MLSHRALSRLATLCDARAHNLRKMIADGLDEDETSDAEMDITYLDGLATMLRGARDGGQSVIISRPYTTETSWRDRSALSRDESLARSAIDEIGWRGSWSIGADLSAAARVLARYLSQARKEGCVDAK